MNSRDTIRAFNILDSNEIERFPIKILEKKDLASMNPWQEFFPFHPLEQFCDPEGVASGISETRGTYYASAV
jgi:hypothetical protein